MRIKISEQTKSQELIRSVSVLQIVVKETEQMLPPHYFHKF
jgi:hypothetical protein